MEGVEEAEAIDKVEADSARVNGLLASMPEAFFFLVIIIVCSVTLVKKNKSLTLRRGSPPPCAALMQGES